MKAPIISRNTGAANDLKDSSVALESIIDTYEVPDLRIMYSELVSALACFGTCELHARQADRCDALSIDADRIDYEERMLARFQAIGLNTISAVQEIVQDLQGVDFGDTLSIPNDQLAAWSAAQGDYKHFISDMEISGNDASLIWGKVADAVSAATNGGENGLVNYIADQVQDLIDARNSSDRGTTPNIAWWKLAAIAVVCAVSIWLVIRCFKRKNCEDLWTIVNGALTVGSKLVTLFC